MHVVTRSDWSPTGAGRPRPFRVVVVLGHLGTGRWCGWPHGSPVRVTLAVMRMRTGVVVFWLSAAGLCTYTYNGAIICHWLEVLGPNSYSCCLPSGARARRARGRGDEGSLWRNVVEWHFHFSEPGWMCRIDQSTIGQ